MNEFQAETNRRLLSAMIHDTSKLRQPQVGDRYRSSDDVIELTYVSEPLFHGEKTDRVVTFNVLEVLSENSSMKHQDVSILFGDLMVGVDAYVLVHERLIPHCADTSYNDIVNEVLQDSEPVNIEPITLNTEANMNDEIFHLDSLFLACALANHAEHGSIVGTLEELVDAKVVLRKRMPERPNLESERAFAVLIRNDGNKAWERRFSEVIASLGLSMKRLASVHKCADAYSQHEDGLTTVKEFVYFLIDDMVKKASQETLEYLKVQRLEK